ncbi:MAG TPA: glycosyltransferase [Chitinophagales bacterium]|nr:glycosyltransferase [Chitinophagales bacterium]HRK28096.1 glycosyltransferase [Chitinophagales bacterium]
MAELLLLTSVLVCLVFITLYCLAEMYLAWQYQQAKQPVLPLPPLPRHQLPFVTVQLPVYNEQYVVERLIDAIAAFDYPLHLFEIQILDDSTDVTTNLIAAKTRFYQLKGLQIYHLHRTNRTGFKAGALQDALPIAKGSLIAIFDADFLPQSDFLQQTIPYFTNPQLGMLQTRWQFINRRYSLFTQVQAFFMDAHFTVEQGGRTAAHAFMNFNGTAGVWRKQTITDAGGWQPDTLTEDLDLSYRAQLNGSKFAYAPHIIAPSELPPDMPAFKAQQFRWIKGGAETAAKLLPRLWHTPLPFTTRLHGTVHLLSSSVYIAVLVFYLLSLPLLMVKNRFFSFNYLHLGSVFMVSIVAMIYVHFIAAKHTIQPASKAYKRVALLLFPFLTLTLGLSLHNAHAALQGWLRKKTPFVRTPKYNITQNHHRLQNRYAPQKLNITTFAEAIIGMYFAFAVVYAVVNQYWGLVPMYIMASAGFWWVFAATIVHTLAAKYKLPHTNK